MASDPAGADGQPHAGSRPGKAGRLTPIHLCNHMHVRLTYVKCLLVSVCRALAGGAEILQGTFPELILGAES